MNWQPQFSDGDKKVQNFMCMDVCICPVVQTSFFFLAIGSAFCYDSQVEEAEEGCCNIPCLPAIPGQTELYWAPGCTEYSSYRSMWEAEHFNFTKAHLILECWFFQVSTGGQVSLIQGKYKLFLEILQMYVTEFFQ